MSDASKSSWTGKIRSFFGAQTSQDPFSREELEALLYQSDLSISFIQTLLSQTDKVRKKGQEAVLQSLFEQTKKALDPICENPFEVQTPSVILLLGINGSGKTTSAARLGHYLKNQGHKVLFAAGDTFRAGAIDQLKLWGEKLDIECIASDYKSDPASVIFDGWQKAKAQNAVLIADTAGRLHTQAPLMEQLSKIVRVLKKDEDLNLQSLLVLDGTNGQNALIQSKEFSKDVDVDGLIMTKLDGSSKGGAVISSSMEMQVPIRFIGVGEKKSDFVPFEVDSFLHSFYGI